MNTIRTTGKATLMIHACPLKSKKNKHLLTPPPAQQLRTTLKVSSPTPLSLVRRAAVSCGDWWTELRPLVTALAPGGNTSTLSLNATCATATFSNSPSLPNQCHTAIDGPPRRTKLLTFHAGTQPDLLLRKRIFMRMC